MKAGLSKLFGKIKASISFENRTDNVTQTGTSNHVTVKAGNVSKSIYPWGKNNRLPNEKIELLKSNSDLINLLDTKKDFLFGAGIGVFQQTFDSGDLVLSPIESSKFPKLNDFLQKNDLQEYNERAGCYMVDTANIFNNITIENDKIPTLIALDPTLCRCDSELVKGYVKNVVTCGNWAEQTPTNAIVTPTLLGSIAETKIGEYIHIAQKARTGQFYYSYPTWWAAEPAIKIANRLWTFHDNGLDTQNNARFIVRVSKQYFERFGREYEGGIEKFKNDFYDNVDSLMSGELGSNRMIYDECDSGPNGLQGYIEFVPIPVGISGDEYLKLYETTILAIANSSGVLSNIAGVSNGKVMGGSGSELRVSAEFQQKYRTPVERTTILRVLNQKIKPALELPPNIVFAYKDIVLTTLDKNHTGSETATSNTN